MAALPSTPSTGNTTFVNEVESEKKLKDFAKVTVTSIHSTEQRPAIVGRRRTLSNLGQRADAKQLGYAGDEDALTKIGNFLYKVHSFSIITRYALYILPVATLLAIPLILTATIYENAKAGDVRLVGLFIWIEIVWVSLWICKLCAQAIPYIFQAACGLISSGIRKYSLVLQALEIPLSLFFWSIANYATTYVIYIFSKCHGRDTCNDSWVEILQKAFRAAIVVAAIFLAEKTIVQLLSINYHRKQYDAKIQESKKLVHQLDLLYEASRTIFPEYCHEFAEEDGDIQGNTLADMRTTLERAGIKTKVVRDMGRVRDKVTAAFGTMASDISGKQVFSTTSAHSIVLEALETERASKALARRLWLSFVGEGRDVLLRHDLEEVLRGWNADEIDDLYHTLDRDGNGDISLDEMTQLVVDVGTERKNRATSMQDISQAIAVLDRLLSFVVLIAIAFIYATFFSETFASKTTQLWTTFTGLAFAIGGTVTEFLACCIFIFVKHAYDVGDRIDINGVELIVEHISLMYSVYRRVDSDKMVQIPNNIANTLWIENVTRSKAMKERLNFAVAATTSSEDILALRDEMEKFVTAPDNKRDFRPEFDIELLSVGDMKQLELRVEIRHRSNFSNELIRSSRRNKFMCELLASMRRVPIEPPGGSAPALGDPKNPSYSVAVTDTQAITTREKKAADDDAKRLFPKNSGLMSGKLNVAVSSALENPATTMIGSIAGLRGAQTERGERRSSEESMRIARVSSSSNRVHYKQV